MILTVTTNPMVEHIYSVPGFSAGGAFRPPSRGRLLATGKPLNVARALFDLGDDVRALVALGGTTGREIEELLGDEGLSTRFVALRHGSRRGFTVYDERGVTTTVYGPPPKMSDDEVDAVIAAVRCMLPVRKLVLGGSTSRPDLYARLCSLDVPVVLDAQGAALTECLAVGEIAVVKPNLRECQRTFGVRTGPEAVEALASRGARTVVVTDEDRSAWFRVGGALLRATPPKVDVVHTVGCGDALCAGLLHAKGRPAEEVVAFAMACGAYAATRPDVARLDRAACEALASRVEVERL
ncbi:MAG: hypothetical protein H6739_18940 [Alphaproteobacteria bacterium]|nr:hypothetical protein [Alphaproteobacteria bacterium]